MFRGNNQFSFNIEDHELVVDNFAGGGGASTGIELAIGRQVDIAINHDPDAIAMHKTNHPLTKHYCESVWDINPVEACAGRPVGLAWFSPDCKHFSKAAGGKPLEKKIRGLAWVAMRWAATVRPRIIMLENVEEFVTWGPVIDGKPCQKRKGDTFKSFVHQLRQHGYDVKWKELIASDYGCPTIRKRFFLVARCDCQPITFPKPTHGNPNKQPVNGKTLKTWKTAADIIDWSIPCKSIFNRKKPIVEKSLNRIYKGISRFVIDTDTPFIAPKEARIIQHGQYLQYMPSNAESLVASFMVKYRGTNVGFPMTEPMHTITAGGNHLAEVRVFLIKYFGTGIGQDIEQPLHTITTKDRFGLVMVHGNAYRIFDIGLRILEPHELFAAQSFPSDYIINVDHTGKKYSKAKQVARCGNSVPPLLAAALVNANYQTLINIEQVA
jgi:DNA (cytosine-5)-methyltransferase 1